MATCRTDDVSDGPASCRAKTPGSREAASHQSPWSGQVIGPRRVLILTKTLLILCLGLGSRASLAGEDRHLAEYLWAGVKAHREQLKTGVVRISCKKRSKGSPNDPERSELKTVEVSFDHAMRKRLFRIDEGPKSQRIWMNTQDAWYGWRPGSGAVLEVLPPTYLQGKQEFTPDVRIIGISAPMGILMGTTFEKIEENNRQRAAFHDVRREGEGLCAVSWLIHARGSDVLQTVLINESKGFTAERYTLRPWKEGASSTATKPAILLTASWEPRGGTWVPTHVEANESGFMRTEFTFQWKSVNQPLGTDVFDVEKLGIPKGTLVVDNRLDEKQPIIVAKVGEPDYEPPSMETQKGRSPQRMRAGRLALQLTIAITTLVIVVLLVLRFVRKAKPG